MFTTDLTTGARQRPVKLSLLAILALLMLLVGSVSSASAAGNAGTDKPPQGAVSPFDRRSPRSPSRCWAPAPRRTSTASTTRASSRTPR